MGDTEKFQDREALVQDGAFSVRAMVEFTGLSRALIYREMQAGRLPYLKQGRRTLIPRRAAIQLLAAGLRSGGSANGTSAAT